MESAMATTEQHAPDAAAGNVAGPTRSDNLLPPGEEDSDGRFEVAEEVNLDEQSDAARRIGQAPDQPAPNVPGAAPDEPAPPTR
jgi:hypothetical protein